MKGIELALRFSYMPNALQYCGPKVAHSNFLKYISNSSNTKTFNPKDKEKLKGKIKNNLKNFEALYPYLSAIAKKSKKDYSDYKVVEAYWIGNKILEKFNKKDMAKIIFELGKKGLPKIIAKKTIENLKEGFVPHHNFNVGFVGVGQVSGSVPTTLKNMNNCMILPAKILKIEKSLKNNDDNKKEENNLIVSRVLLERENGKYKLTKNDMNNKKNNTHKIKVKFLPNLFKKIKVGDTVAIHWNFAAKILTNKEEKNLLKYTNQILETINSKK